MSDRPDALKQNSRDKSPPAVKFTIRNPEALFRPEVARSIVQLIRAPIHQQEPAPLARAG